MGITLNNDTYRSEFKGAYLGFKYDGIHSAQLGIVRINDGDRAELALSPSFKDNTSEISGRDGLLYFNTSTQQMQWEIKIGFDNLDEYDIKNLKILFSKNKIAELVFDEMPYKSYKAKISSPIKLNYLPIAQNKKGRAGMSDDGYRVYKGDGTISLSAYEPYAHAPYQTLNEYSDWIDGDWISGSGSAAEKLKSEEQFTAQKSEWSASSGLNIDSTYKKIIPVIEGSAPNYSILVYNLGEISSPLKFNLAIAANASNLILYLLYSYTDHDDNSLERYMYLDSNLLPKGKTYCVDSKLKLITDSDGNVYNNALIAGDFLQIKAENIETISGSGSPLYMGFISTAIPSADDYKITNIEIPYYYI